MTINRKPVLFLMTNRDHITLKDGKKHATGFYASEFAEPHEAIKKAGFDVKVATEDGTTPPLDQVSVNPANVGQQRATELKSMVKGAQELRQAISYDDVNVSDYSAVVIPGGHSPMENMPVSPKVGRILRQAHKSGLVVAALCHGPAALLAAQDDGEWVFKGKDMTSFSLQEEQLVPAVAGRMKWELEPALAQQGGQFMKSAASSPFEAFVVQDGNLITGENPESAPQFADKVVTALTDPSIKDGKSVAFGVHRDVDAPVEEVRRLLGNFDDLSWHPGLEGGTVEGHVRQLKAAGPDGPTFTEELQDMGPGHVTYKMTGGLPFQPVSTISFRSNENGGTRIDWKADADTAGQPDEVVKGVTAGVTAFYDAGLDALVERFKKDD